jgi:hypothetical protein
MTKMFYNAAPRNLDEAKTLLLKAQREELGNEDMVLI